MPGAARPKAVFLDLNMPGSNGFDLLARVRADHAMTGMPVVVLTTSKNPPTSSGAIGWGPTAL